VFPQGFELVQGSPAALTVKSSHSKYGLIQVPVTQQPRPASAITPNTVPPKTKPLETSSVRTPPPATPSPVRQPRIIIPRATAQPPPPPPVPQAP
jgi:hypothetical protein